VRARFARLVATGKVRCCRCGQIILVSDSWDLDHEDIPDAHKRGLYKGVSHRSCNIGARNSNLARRARGEPAEQPRPKAKAWVAFFEGPPCPPTGRQVL
jgi:hypothetical protein